MSRSLRTLVVVSLAVVVAGCPTIGTLTSARTLAPGKAQFGAEFTGGAISSGFDVSGRYGVSEGVEVGVKGGTHGGVLTGKFRLTPANAGVLVSVAPEFGGIAFGFGDSAGSAGAGSLHAQLPVLIGIPLGGHELVFAPKLVWWDLFAGASGGTAGSTAGATGMALFGGASVGFALRLGGMTVLPEFAFVRPMYGWGGAGTGGASTSGGSSLTDGGSYTQLSLALLFGGNDDAF